MKEEKFPSWIPRLIITLFITAIITGAFGWASATSTKDVIQDKDIAVIKTNINTLDKSLDEMKMSQRRIEDKLDKALEK